MTRLQRATPTRPKQRRAMDFIHDALTDETNFRVLNVIDLCTCECVTLVPKEYFLPRRCYGLAEQSETSTRIASRHSRDNVTEFTSKARDHWAYWNHAHWDFNRPGRPTDNASIESFHNSFRRARSLHIRPIEVED